MRRFVIGDIHGCAKALRTVIETIAPNPEDELIFLGDYIDRGPDSRNVIDQMINLQSTCRTITLRGNHELMLQGVVFHGFDDSVWKKNGGGATVNSYGGSLNKIPDSHLQFFQDLRPYYENAHSIFVHACYHPELPMHKQDDMCIYWMHLPFPPPVPHCSGKRVFVGHTPQPEGTVLDLGHLVCVDTYCFGGGLLTAMDVDTGDVIQANRHGHLHAPPIAIIAERIKRLATFTRTLCQQTLRRKSSQMREATAEK